MTSSYLYEANARDSQQCHTETILSDSQGPGQIQFGDKVDVVVIIKRYKSNIQFAQVQKTSSASKQSQLRGKGQGFLNSKMWIDKSRVICPRITLLHLIGPKLLDGFAAHRHVI